MNIEIWKRLFKDNFISKKEYEKALTCGEVDEYKLIQNETGLLYFLRGDLSKGIDPRWVRKNVMPPLGIENYYQIFDKFGYSYYGIGEGWHWYEEGEHRPYEFCRILEEATQEELWQLTAIAMTYWVGKNE